MGLDGRHNSNINAATWDADAVCALTQLAKRGRRVLLLEHLSLLLLKSIIVCLQQAAGRNEGLVNSRRWLVEFGGLG
jgi:hypothetical protein